MKDILFNSPKHFNKEEDIESFYNIIYSYEMRLIDYYQILSESGLNKEDIPPLENILKELMDLEYAIKNTIRIDIQHRYSCRSKHYDEEEREYLFRNWTNYICYERELLNYLGSIAKSYYNILRELKKKCLTMSSKDFVKENSSLLLLVSTNHHRPINIFKKSDDAFLYCCQFHNENSPSMRVNAHSNTFSCYGCGERGNIISYIMNYEGLDYYHALALLSAIFYLPFEDNPYHQDSELVRKYTNPKALAKYRMRLVSGLKRAQKKDKTFNNYLAIENYQRELALLERIKSKEYISLDNELPQNHLSLQYSNIHKQS